eukprot:jgi/Tetstr1/463526/TSEL_008405.t1
MADPAAEVAALDRVLGRLAMTEEAQLEKVLSKLLPLVIEKLKLPGAQKKVMEILTHTNNRIRDQKHIKLPLADLIALYLKPDAAAMARNFALVYTEMAFERASPTERGDAVGQLLQGVSERSPQHRAMLTRMAIRGLQGHTTPAGFRLEKDKEAIKAKYAFMSSDADRKVFLDHALKLMLYLPPVYIPKPAAPQTLAVAPPQPAAGAPPPAEEAAAPPGVAPGLSRADAAWVEGKDPPGVEALAATKTGILNFLCTCEVEPKDALLHFLVAACDFNEPVSRRGEELLRKRCGVDAHKPAVDMEERALVASLYRLFLGTQGLEVPEDQAAQLASPAVRLRIIGLFCKSITAANFFPGTLKVIFSSVGGDSSTQRLKNAGMEFAVWVFKHAKDEQLKPVAPGILRALLAQLDEVQGQQDAQSSMLRGFTYQAIGQLAQRSGAIFQKDISIAERLFAALSTEPPGTRATLQEAVSTLAVAYKGSTGETAVAIHDLLLQSIKSAQEPTRLCAVQWAVKLYSFNHIASRYVCMLAAGDFKLEVREEGLQGLKKPKAPKARVGAEPVEVLPEDQLPDPVSMLAYLVEQHPSLGHSADASKPLVLKPAVFLEAVKFIRRCWEAQPEGSPRAAPDMEAYLHLLEAALVPDGTNELQEIALEALLEAAYQNQEFHAKWLAARMPWLTAFLSHTAIGVRSSAAKLTGLAVMGMGAPGAAAALVSLAAPLSDDGEGAKDKKAKYEQVDGSLAALGYVLAQVGHATSGGPAVGQAELEAAATALFGALFKADTSLAARAAAALGHAGLRGPLPLPLGAAPPAAEAEDGDGDGDKSKGAGGGEEGGRPEPSQVAVVRRLAELVKDRDMKVVMQAARATGHLCAGSEEAALLEPAAEALLALATNKTEEVQFAVGDALAFAFGGVCVGADEVLRSGFESLAVSNRFFSAGGDGGDTEMAEAAGPASGAAAPAASPAREAMQGVVLGKLMEEYVYHSRVEVRCAACIWLLSLVAFTQRHPRLMAMLPEIQEAFSSLLGDANELTQDMASRGMSIVYAIGDAATREKLVAGLVGTLQGGPKKRRAVKLTGDTQVFEEGTIGEAPGGGSLSTYKELCALATDLGQPDLVYRFMDLANHQAALTSRRGAAFGFASIAKLAGEQLGPHVAALVPKLYRYQYDPNPRVSEAMSHIWHALVPDPKATVDANYAPICKELLKEMGGRLWRNREASASGLADLLQGRRWEDVSGTFEDIWVMALRAMDDIKESVRQAAAKLIRTLRGLTLRLCDPAHTPKADAAATTAVIVPLLLSTKGVAADAAEVRGLAVTTIAKICKTASADQLQPFLPDLTVVMLESLTQLEDQRLNYVEQHAERLGVSSDKLESVRVSAAKSSPMGDTLDLCARLCTAPTLEALIPRLVQLIKRGVGLNTRCGAANFVVQLTTRHGADMKAHTAVLIKALLSAAKGERSVAVRRAYASTSAQLARFASETRVVKLLTEAVTMFSEAEGGDRDARVLAGMIVREMARQAPDTLSRNAALVMPLAFTARHDEDADVAELWKEVWEEGTTSEAAAIRLYATELAPLMVQALGSQQWARKVMAAKSIGGAAAVAGDALAPARA